MRLLDAEALIYDNVARLVEFTDASRAPDYAILSHTWEEEEVLFEDIKLGPQHEIATHYFFRQDLRSKGSLDLTSSVADLRRASDIESISIETDDDETDFFSVSEASDENEDVSMSNDGTGDAVSESTKDSLPNSPADALGLHVKEGWNKVLNTCLLTVRDQLRYVWIDTCKYNPHLVITTCQTWMLITI